MCFDPSVSGHGEDPCGCQLPNRHKEAPMVGISKAKNPRKDGSKQVMKQQV
jgi:hypothetical protein